MEGRDASLSFALRLRALGFDTNHQFPVRQDIDASSPHLLELIRHTVEENLSGLYHR